MLSFCFPGGGAPEVEELQMDEPLSSLARQAVHRRSSHPDAYCGSKRDLVTLEDQENGDAVHSAYGQQVSLDVHRILKESSVGYLARRSDDLHERPVDEDDSKSIQGCSGFLAPSTPPRSISGYSTKASSSRAPLDCWGSPEKPPPMRMLLLCTGLTKAPFFEAMDKLLIDRKDREDLHRIIYIPDGCVGRGADCESLTQSFAHKIGCLSCSCEVMCVELRRHTPASLAQNLEGADCIFVDCGATFYLRHYMRTSGFDQIVPNLVKNHGVVYVGASAGGICSGSTVSIAFWKGWDDPGYGTEWDLKNIGYNGLGLIPGGKSVFPHYSENFRPLVESKRQELNHELIVLDEDHCYISIGSLEILWPSLPTTAPQNWRQHVPEDWCWKEARSRANTSPADVEVPDSMLPRPRGNTWGGVPPSPLTGNLLGADSMRIVVA